MQNWPCVLHNILHSNTPTQNRVMIDRVKCYDKSRKKPEKVHPLNLDNTVYENKQQDMEFLYDFICKMVKN